MKKSKYEMNYIKAAKQFAQGYIAKYPQHRSEIEDIYGLFLNEVQEEGASVINEYNLMTSDIVALCEGKKD